MDQARGLGGAKPNTGVATPIASDKPPKSATTTPDSSRQAAKGKGIMEQARRGKGSDKPAAKPDKSVAVISGTGPASDGSTKRIGTGATSNPSAKAPTNPENAKRPSGEVADGPKKPGADTRSKIVSAATERRGDSSKSDAPSSTGKTPSTNRKVGTNSNPRDKTATGKGLQLLDRPEPLPWDARVFGSAILNDKTANLGGDERGAIERSLDGKPLPGDADILNNLRGRRLSSNPSADTFADAALSAMAAQASSQTAQETQPSATPSSPKSVGSAVVNLLSGFAAGGLPNGLMQLGAGLDLLGTQVCSPDCAVEADSPAIMPSRPVVQPISPTSDAVTDGTIASVPSNAASYLVPATPQPNAVDPQEVMLDSLPSDARRRPDTATADAVPAADDFLVQGQSAFAARDYVRAEKAWRHAVADDSENGTLWLLHAQALFASGNFDRSASAVRRGMMLLDEDDWGVVVANYHEIYFTDSQTNDYVTQLQALEKAVQSQPSEPALHFLLGYHYGFLGYPDQARPELDQLVELAPNDQLGRELREVMTQIAITSVSPSER